MSCLWWAVESFKWTILPCSNTVTEPSLSETFLKYYIMTFKIWTDCKTLGIKRLRRIPIRQRVPPSLETMDLNRSIGNNRIDSSIKIHQRHAAGEMVFWYKHRSLKLKRWEFCPRCISPEDKGFGFLGVSQGETNLGSTTFSTGLNKHTFFFSQPVRDAHPQRYNKTRLVLRAV